MLVKAERRECDLAAPICAYLTAQGYTVRSEVNSCDITATQGDDLVVIELKRNFSTDLLIQAIERQRVADSVYVAIPLEGELAKQGRFGKRWRGIERLLKRLGLGLILVTFAQPPDGASFVEVAFHPIEEQKPRRKPHQRKSILREIAGRSGDYNLGGSTKRQILTAYREQAIFIALCLDRFGPMTPCGLRTCGASPKTQNILFRNVYGWFERLDRGLYAVRPQVTAHLMQTWPQATAHHAARLDTAPSEGAP
jgi:hypothetical protein